jgi:YbbR domain-containing protein
MNARSIFRNASVKIFALILATIFWFFMSAPRRERSIDRSFAVPLAVVGLPRELIITTPVPDTVNIRLRARISVLRSLSSQSIEASIDLSGFSRGGDVIVPIRPSSVNVPSGVEVVGVDPAKVALHMDPRRQKVVPVREYLVGELPTGYTLGNVEVIPKDVLISGPLSLVRNVGEVATDRIILTGRTSTFERMINVVPDTPLISIVEPLSVSVTVEVVPPSTSTETSTDTTSTTSTQ